MNILVISQAKGFIGGANRSLFDVIWQLKSIYGHNISVVVPEKGDFSTAVAEKGIEYMFFPYLQNTFTIMHDIFDPYRFFNALKNDIKNRAVAKKAAKEILGNGNKYDCVYINDSSNTFGYYLALYLNTKYVWHFRNYNENVKRYLLSEKKLRDGKKGICIAISNAMKDFMVTKRHISEKSIIVIHNGVKNQNDKIIPWRERVSNGEFHCVHCGLMLEIKGQLTSIEAISILRKQGYNVFLHLAGGRPANRKDTYMEKLKKTVAQLEIEDSVIFEGEVSDMVLFRKNMAIELMCSKAEPFGRVTVEGMQAGLVVIGANTGATPEIIDDEKNGLLFQQGNAFELAEKIKIVIDNPAMGELLAANGVLFTKNNFTMDKNVAQINCILEKCINK